MRGKKEVNEEERVRESDRVNERKERVDLRRACMKGWIEVNRGEGESEGRVSENESEENRG